MRLVRKRRGVWVQGERWTCCDASLFDEREGCIEFEKGEFCLVTITVQITL